ncbi:hypothetical protein SCHPADRAFT_946727 [Schizopora paradoxa]|uniref:Uncharacterized protein n=1 Tax=Schizopora paradoxa TaxID=27342 RepID=A0A0H2R2T5_9AGAM|nr:hypothetical protein SCHPADRAFT_946727 [Schizopora paradoxa]
MRLALNDLQATCRSWVLILLPLSLLVTLVLSLASDDGLKGLRVLRRTQIIDDRFKYKDITANAIWDVGDLGKVRMLVEDTVHYELETARGEQEWGSLVPEGGGSIYLENASSGEVENLTISLFHQLDCLNVFRKEIVQLLRPPSEPPVLSSNAPLIYHCINYLQQAILYRADLTLVNVRKGQGEKISATSYVRTCKDWRKVYQAFELRQKLIHSGAD